MAPMPEPDVNLAALGTHAAQVDGFPRAPLRWEGPRNILTEIAGCRRGCLYHTRGSLGGVTKGRQRIARSASAPVEFLGGRPPGGQPFNFRGCFFSQPAGSLRKSLVS